MFTVALVDDEQMHLQQNKRYLKQYCGEENTYIKVLEFHNGLDFVEEYDGKIDIVFMDIEMPLMNGLEAAKKIRQKDESLAIIFITNMAQYAIKGYEVNAIDFIVKPIEYFVFKDKFQKAIRFAKTKEEKQVVITVEDETIKIPVSHIMYIEKERNYLIYYTKKETYRMRGTMLSVEEELSVHGFAKCISGCLVNLKHVTKLKKEEVWINELVLPISRQQKKSFKEAFMKYLGGGY